MSTFVIVPGAWDRPAALEPVVEPLGSAGHDVILVDLPCENPDASLEEYADAARSVLPDDLSQVVLVGYPLRWLHARSVARLPMATRWMRSSLPRRLGGLARQPRTAGDGGPECPPTPKARVGRGRPGLGDGMRDAVRERAFGAQASIAVLSSAPVSTSIRRGLAFSATGTTRRRTPAS
jgi:hypothetical protein